MTTTQTSVYWRVEGRRFESYIYARAFAEQLVEKEKRDIAIMQKDDEMFPFFVLETVSA